MPLEDHDAPPHDKVSCPAVPHFAAPPHQLPPGHEGLGVAEELVTGLEGGGSSVPGLELPPCDHPPHPRLNLRHLAQENGPRADGRTPPPPLGDDCGTAMLAVMEPLEGALARRRLNEGRRLHAPLVHPPRHEEEGAANDHGGRMAENDRAPPPLPAPPDGLAGDGGEVQAAHLPPQHPPPVEARDDRDRARGPPELLLLHVHAARALDRPRGADQGGHPLLGEVRAPVPAYRVGGGPQHRHVAPNPECTVGALDAPHALPGQPQP
mmetsp:Transcript_21135/g.66935  ORF Transcript_21135/g.66935 Transcript_21135/m.66935 type:complete len:266 (-) Transcript_21135:177-974(-)